MSNRDAEWARLHDSDFNVLRSSRHGAVVSARGRQVAIDPAPGFCLAEDSIETSPRSVFLLIGDCAVEMADDGARGERGELNLPRAIPGILTVSISGDPGLGTGAGSLDRLEAFLETPEGRAMLGRGGSGRDVLVKESQRKDGALFLLLEDGSTDVVPVLSSLFWRAFIELNGRLTVVTISGFRDRPLERGEMLSYLVSQVQTLAAANVTPPNLPETRLARADTTATDGDDGARTLSSVREEATGLGIAETGTTPETPDAELPDTAAAVADSSEPEPDDAEVVTEATTPGVVLPPRRPADLRSEGEIAGPAEPEETSAPGAPIPVARRGDGAADETDGPAEAAAEPPADTAATGTDGDAVPATGSTETLVAPATGSSDAAVVTPQAAPRETEAAPTETAEAEPAEDDAPATRFAPERAPEAPRRPKR